MATDKAIVLWETAFSARSAQRGFYLPAVASRLPEVKVRFQAF